MQHKSKILLDQRKAFFKLLFAPTMSLEEKQDELWHLPEEDLSFLLEQFKADEDYEICSAIQSVLDGKKSDHIRKLEELSNLELKNGSKRDVSLKY